MNATDPEISFESLGLQYRHQLRNRNFEAASATLQVLTEDVQVGDPDTYQRLELAIFKAEMFTQAGLPQRSFTIALRTAAAAQRAGIYPVLWSAVGLLCTALVALEEYQAAVSLLDSVIPQVSPRNWQSLAYEDLL